MTKKEETKISKLLSLVLRHKPETIGLVLSEEAWADTSELIDKMNANDCSMDMAMLSQVVENNSKRRFAFNNDRSKIRANQGHSLNVDLQLTPKIPPHLLFHGTAIKNIDKIMKWGLNKMERQHVHLSSDKLTAEKVGKRHGKPIVLQVAAHEMQVMGFVFLESENGVWLTDHVPIEFISEFKAEEHES